MLWWTKFNLVSQPLIVLVRPCLILKKWSLITHHSNSIFSLTQNKTCLVSFLIPCNSKFCNNNGTHLLYWVRRNPCKFSFLFFFFFSSLHFCLYSPRPKNFAPLLSFTHWIHHFSLPHSSNQKEQRSSLAVQLRPWEAPLPTVQIPSISPVLLSL